MSESGPSSTGGNRSQDAGSGSSEKPAILQESTFVVEEGIAYKAFRTLSIWMNKLFFSSIVLWVVWLFIAAAQGEAACTQGLGQSGANATDDLDIVAEGTCSAFLTPTSLYLGGATVLSFIASILFGVLGLAVGKKILERTATEDEVGAEESGRE